MFLRRFQVRKNGKSHVYWGLAETYRTARGPRQRIVAYLGELKESEASGWAQLSSKLRQQATGDSPTSSGVQRWLFDPPPREDAVEAALGTQPMLVDLQGIRLERTRDFGGVWLAWGLWRLLALDELLEREMRRGRAEVPWHEVAAILAIARFCEPWSELHIETTWYRRTALEDLLQVPPDKVHTDRLYAGLDALLPHKETIEKHLKERLGDLFDLDYELLLYDVTIQRVPQQTTTGMQTRDASTSDDATLPTDQATRTDQTPHADTTNEAHAKRPKQAKPSKQAKPPANPKTRLEITWQRNEKWSEWARLSEGCYLLRSNINDADAKTLWHHYIQLTDAEWAFRISKDELVLRPIWHHKEDRVQAHILVSFLAYAMWKTLAGWMRRSGLGDAPRSLLDELAKLKSTDVVLPVCGPDGRRHSVRLRCVTEPDSEQKLLLHRLGITPPRRLGSQLLPPEM
jgi:hypothetical protein